MNLDQTMILTDEQNDSFSGAQFKTILEETSTVNNEHFDFDENTLNDLAEINSAYDLGEKFAEGAQGELITGTDKLLKRYVAIKSLKKDLITKPGVVNSFVTEAIVTAQLDHPSIIPLYGISRDEENGLHISMKLVHGQTLTDLIKRDRAQSLKPKQEASALTQRLEHFIHVCDAVAYAHEKKVIHRDLKPQNIMVGHFHEVYVMDWGIAQTFKEENRDIIQTSTAGTPGYIAPEILNKALPDPKSDQYSLAIIFYELVCLKSALDNSNVQARFLATHSGNLPALKHFCPKVKIHPDLKAIFRKASHLDPQQRYPDVTALANDIRQYIKKEEVTARPDNFIRKAYRIIAAHHHQAAAMFLGTMLIFAGTTINSLTEQNAAVESSKQREIKLLDLRSNIATRSQEIDRHFQQLSSILQRYSDKVSFLLQNPKNYQRPRLYSYKAFKSPENIPPGTVFSSSYRQKINLDLGNYKVGNELKNNNNESLINGLSPVIDDSLRYMAESKETNENLTPSMLKTKILNEGFPVRWMYFGLTNGFFANYPGNSQLSETYDPRNRPWFIQSSHNRKVNWSEPYEDAFGLGSIISASISMRDKNNQLLGVAAFDLTLNDAKSYMTSTAQNKSLIASYLIDKSGKVIISSNDQLNGKKLPIPGLLDHINEERAGQYELVINGQNVMIDYAPIPTLSWYYIEQIDINKFLFNE